MKEEFLNLFLRRRSIRTYRDKDVSDDILEEIVRIGMNAPSAGNQQPWEFIIIKDRTSLSRITEVHPYSKMLLNAPAGILVCGKQDCKHPDYWVQDCSAATQNILLAIHALGLGGVWLGVYPLEDRVEGIRRLFEVPRNIIPFSLISLGFPSIEPKFMDRFNKDKIHLEKW